MTDEAYYQGAAKAIHSEDYDHSHDTGGGTSTDEAVYEGSAPKLTTHEDKPKDWADAEIIGPPVGPGYIMGRSQAIHVHGEEIIPDPPGPVSSCNCEDYGYGEGSGDGIPEDAGWDPDWVYGTQQDNFDGRPRVPVSIVPAAFPADDIAIYAGTFGDLSTGWTNAGKSWMWAEVPTIGAGTEDLGITAGYVELYYQFTQSEDHIQATIVRMPSNPNVDFDDTIMYQVGACYLNFGVFPVKLIYWYFWYNSSLGTWSIRIQHNSGFTGDIVVRTGVPDWLPGQMYHVRVLVNAADSQEFKVKIWHNSEPEPASYVGTSIVAVPLANLRSIRFYVSEQSTPVTAPPTGVSGQWDLIWHDVGERRIEGVEVNGVPLGSSTTTPAAGCDECEDPDNPGFHLPPFMPGYLPIFRRQIGDPTTTLDSFICTFESGAMVLDWHTRGAIQVWGGQLIPYSGRSESSIFGSGSNLTDVQRAWSNGWGQYLDIRSGQTWTDLIECLQEGRAVILQGDYDQISIAERCQVSLVGNHAMSLYPYQQADRIMAGDPICFNFKGYKISELIDYAEKFGEAVFGITSPQKILFAVSRPWVP